MKRIKELALDFEIDKLTNSIQNTISGDSFLTEIALISKTELKPITKKNGWAFNWKKENEDSKKQVYKLTIVNNSGIIQGLVSLSIESDHVFMNLVESAPFNIGKSKLYAGVAGNLVAYACKVAFEMGFDGFVAFDAKTKLIDHYVKTLGAYHFGGRRMIIPTKPVLVLVDKYFKS